MLLAETDNNKWDWSAPAGMGGGREKRGTHAGEMLTPVFFCFFFTPPSSRDVSAAARVDLTTYGMVGSMTGHMTGCRRESRRRRNV